jgi:hypothetical protein
MTAKCHVCGTREPENPSVAHPVCHACRNSHWTRMQRPEAVRRAQKREALETLALAVVNLRRACMAVDGVESLSPYHPPISLARPSKPG